MSRNEILEQVTDIFRDEFDDDSIVLTDDTVAGDVDGWDSLMHISLLAAIEDAFDFKFEMKEVVGMKNVGEMLDIIERETA
ncbi:MAG: acyl carrier protein [Faecousia sp.]